jgi:hypothetical protein
MMIKMGFCPEWTELIMNSVSSVSYSVRYNSQLTEGFIPTRGIRQGDICLLHEDKEVVRGIVGIKVCRNAPSDSHLLFSDDSLILLKADLHNATSLQQVLDTYYANSG